MNNDHKADLASVYHCFRTENGQKVLKWMQEAYDYRVSFDSDPYVTAFNEGQRSVYLSFLNMMEIFQNEKKE